MRRIGSITFALILVTCGGAPPRAASSATPPVSPSTSLAPVATPLPTYAPSAEGFNSKLLVEKPRNLSTSSTGYVWIVAGAITEGTSVSAVVSERESFTASYQSSTDRRSTDVVAYATPDLPPLAAGRYTESLRLVVVQPGGRSAAHMHSGIEGVLVLEGRVLIRSGGNSPAFLATGQGFYILPQVPIQLINAGDAVVRTLVYSISPEGAPFSTNLDKSP
ncbi:MAG TPA: cupin domain-containing protein [Candidatus Limnocylindria bacterium]|jgi:quercetin dioxygenase-like cupin family protein|nr:cupin domain-containing protein [Candidatus Limnocylindria bacterium]